MGGKPLRNSGKGKFTVRHQASWFIFLGKLIKSGFALQHAVNFTVGTVYNKWSQLQPIPQRMAHGKTFAEAVKPIVKPTLYHQLILAEQHGNLDDCLLKVGQIMELKEKQRQKLWGILMYPLLLAGLLTVMFVLLRLFVFPELSQWSADNQLPSFLQLMITGGWIILGITLIYTMGMAIRFWRASRVQRASMLASLPVVGKSFQSYYGYYLTIHLTMLLERGLSLHEICDVLVDSEVDTLITDIAKEDIKEKKKYILRNFKYREYAEYFSRKIKKAVQELDTLPDGYGTTGFCYRGYDIYLKAYKNYLLFYTVDKSAATVTVLRILQDGMDWENIIRQWISRKH